MNGKRAGILGLFCLVVSWPTTVTAQGLPDEIVDREDGAITLSFPARPGVCFHYDGHRGLRTYGSSDWEPECRNQMLMVTLTVDGGSIVRARLGPPARRSAKRFVAPDVAAEFLLDLVPELDRRSAGDAIEASALADEVEVWPRLLELARQRDLGKSVNRSARFWLAEAARRAVNPDHHANGDSVKDAAVFALSQMGRDGEDALMDLARDHRDPRVRSRAIFWLGQSRAPEPLDLFEEILTAKLQ